MTGISKNQSETLNIFRFLPVSTVNGPGKRAVLWVQGCNHNCPGCFNKESWPIVEKERVSIERLVEIIGNTDGIEGVTFSGGEPLLQARSLSILANKIKSLGLSVMCYTGYTWEEIQNLLKVSMETSYINALNMLLLATDILITGQYIQDLPPVKKWTGSSNQEVIFLSDTYKYLESNLLTGKKEWEINISRKGDLFVTGFLPDNADLIIQS